MKGNDHEKGSACRRAGGAGGTDAARADGFGAIPVVPALLIRHVGPEEAELRAQWADAIGLAWYAETPAARVEAQAVADRIWLQLVAFALDPTGQGAACQG